MPGRGTAHHRGVGDAPGDYDVRTLGERLDDPEAAQVRVGGDEARHVTDRLAGLEVREVDTGRLQLAQARHQIVAAHVRDRGGETESGRDLLHRFGAVIGVETPGVGHDFDVLVQAGAHHLLHLDEETARVAGTRTLHLGPREDQHRQLREPVASQYVDRSALDHFASGGDAVAVEARAVRDAQRCGHDQPASSSSIVSRTVPLSTCWAAVTKTSLTTPALGALITCSIFMASMTTSVSPTTTC